ncbi:TetR/AcrR family transcriptional regulator [Nocardia cyriacigeorgica]|uniref:TetR/AcrR family transcriptional regulator n=1 Tax=Nocardia cyriacigeorgica TaxID=135487 RepID=UPI000CEB6B6C|nr:TetR/AcrR family transcriptional regulator [Nocardia cyriacigeorgica]AVH22424.1 TetR family transcriptional regulator [Nocardia cyriacigeorgica]MBF6086611.1 TetR family transcriptional regulator [Nocardia cyriacigeorgica]MBF6091075.1 TetR family transcriptional regulator [Nocardia cyriacigeorgica]MBF6322050.1 TetR family transcriptional regulator [Nocardia cyriacigeorgica]MBF6497776.1 TetR family transcriptional regulator [Nocardia cyriacigeorgica]
MSTSPGETAKRVRLSPDQRRAQLIELGVKMLGERAIEDISISEIAATAGISRGLLFHYFPTKQDFQLEVVRHANAELLMRVAPDPELGLFDMLRDSVSRYIDYVSENRTSYLALLRGPASSSPDLVALVEQTRNAIVDIILTQVPMSAEERDHPRLVLAVRGWIAFTEESTLSWLRNETIARDDLIDLLVESLLALSMAVNPALAAALRA